MKRYIPLSALLLTLCTGLFAAEDPVALAERQDAEERYKRMNATIEELQASIHAQQQTISKLSEELRNTRDELSKLSNANKEAATQDSLKRLADAIEEVDKKRLADNKNVMKSFNDAIKEIQKIIASNRPVPPVHPPAPLREPGTSGSASTTNSGGTSKTNTTSATEEGYNYVVRPNDSLSGLVKSLNKQGVKITQKQLMDANPDIKWEKLRVGQKVFIPKN